MRSRTASWVVALLTPLAALAVASAQTGPTFEVVSIKPTVATSTVALWSAPLTGRYRGTNMTAAKLVQLAFREASQSRDLEVVNAPAWATADRYAVEATSAALPSFDELRVQMPVMLRNMLSERFKLEAHLETRTVQGYALVMARDDRRLGPKLRATATDCETYVEEKLDPLVMVERIRAGVLPPCNAIRATPTMTMSRGRVMAVLAAELWESAGRPVVDATGLEGRFDYDLEYTRNALAQSDLPTIFTALQEQLGLKLESRQVPQRVIVIDHIERPSPD